MAWQTTDGASFALFARDQDGGGVRFWSRRGFGEYPCGVLLGGRHDAEHKIRGAAQGCGAGQVYENNHGEFTFLVFSEHREEIADPLLRLHLMILLLLQLLMAFGSAHAHKGLQNRSEEHDGQPARAERPVRGSSQHDGRHDAVGELRTADKELNSMI